MSENHPYDKWLGDKLRKLPLPDADKSWPEMRRLLDEEMPEGGGYSKRRGGWWFFGTLLIFIIAGSWTLLTMNFGRQNVDPPLSNTHNSSPPGGAIPEPANQSEKPVAEDDKILHSSVQQDRTATKSIDGEPLNASADESVKVRSDVASANDDIAAERSNEDLVKTSSENPVKRSKGKSPKLSTDKAADLKVGTKTARSIPDQSIPDQSISGQSIRDQSIPGQSIRGQSKPDQSIAGQPVVSGSTPDKSTGKPAATADAGPLATDEEDALKYAHINSVLPIPVGSVALRYDSVSSAHSDTMEYARVNRKYYRQHKKYGTPANVKAPYSTFGRSFAIGLSLPLGFPLGDQKMLGYNINAGGNTASDYLPAPHIQYHFNGKSYIHTEFQMVSPQFIRPVLLYQAHSSNSNYSTTSSVYARKLYYFNVPVSVHYSPFKHFYMGTGLQFSSLLSGVALHEQLRTGMVSSDSIYTTRYAKFSNDSLSRKLNGNEMRLMLDANYYWHRFTVGLRYTQALSNYVNTRVAPAVPYTLDKNKSLQFYMRYNLWEEKRWNTRNRRLMSLK